MLQHYIYRYVYYIYNTKIKNKKLVKSYKVFYCFKINQKSHQNVYLFMF